jgi:hypothetical protein
MESWSDVEGLTHGKLSAQALAFSPGTSVSGFVGDGCYRHGYN